MRHEENRDLIQLCPDGEARLLTALARVLGRDVEARVEGEPTKDDMRRMLRALLAERFKLVTGSETVADSPGSRNSLSMSMMRSAASS